MPMTRRRCPSLQTARPALRTCSLRLARNRPGVHFFRLDMADRLPIDLAARQGASHRASSMMRAHSALKPTPALAAALGSRLDAVKPGDLAAIARTLVQAAKGGDVAAAKELFERVLGKPLAADVLERLEALEARIGGDAP